MAQDTPNSDQAELWNGVAGRNWVRKQSLLDGMFQSLESLLSEAATQARSVLDIGCGAGAVTLAIARAGSPCTGVDISEPLITLARDRAREVPRARFVVADAQTHDFEPKTYDRIVSRFGVMFFQDPARAFANISAASRSGASLDLIAWRGPEENPFMTTAERAAKGLMPEPPHRVPNAPGQFGLADPIFTQSVLETAGWRDVELQALDVKCRISDADLNEYATTMGPVGIMLQSADEATHAMVSEAVLKGFAPFISEGSVRFNAACWRISGRKP